MFNFDLKSNDLFKILIKVTEFQSRTLEFCSVKHMDQSQGKELYWQVFVNYNLQIDLIWA